MDIDRPTIDILMATFNGEAWVGAQLESLLQQTCDDWRILARDDASSDGTVAVLEDFAAKHPQRISIQRNEANLGVISTYNLLMQASGAPYLMLCDQDDVWLPEKVAKTLEDMRQAEALYGNDMPLLVHTDLVVADCDLNPISDSLWAFQKSDPAGGNGLNRVLLQNQVTGCTCMFNRALLETALPLPEGALMHDWWLALCAVAFGRIEQVPEATMLYRQHGQNELGAEKWGWQRFLNLTANSDRSRQGIRKTWRQAQIFHDRFAVRLGKEDAALIAAWADMGHIDKVARIWALFRNGFFYHGLLRNLGLLLLV